MAEESNTEVFLYTEGAMVPEDVVRVRVHPSVTVIPEEAFQLRQKLEDVELNDGLLEIGIRAFHKCKALKRITIPSTVTVICSRAFDNCRKLEEIELFDGLEEIGECAFLRVGPLKRLMLPNTVRSIGDLAFCHAYKLQYLQLPEGIERMGIYTLSHNRFPTCRIPSSLTRLTDSFLGSRCQSMFSLELSEDIAIVERGASQGCHSLRNIAFPPNAEVQLDTFLNSKCTDLQQLFDSDEQLINSLKHRFDNLPIHKMIYYQSYNNVTSDQLNSATSIRISQSRSKLDPSGSQQDCLGMTPLHIMACSTVQNVQLYRVLVDKYPDNLITEDRWGAIPLLYAIWGDAPSEIVQFLVESYNSIHPKYELNWTKLAEQLCLGNASTSSIQRLLDIQQDFPDQTIDWKTIIQKATTSATPVVQADVFVFLVKCSFSKRVDTVGIKQWRDDLTSEIEKHALFEKGPMDDEPKMYVLSRDLPERQRWLDVFSSKLAGYEARYRELKEATTMIELVLWKNKISETSNSKQEGGSRKKMKLDECCLQKECRSRCGADIVIENVLPYLY